jgi:Ca2+-binding EF-hand superfamily protein
MSTTSGISNMRAASVPKVASGASPSISAQQKISSLFQQIDSSGSGRITKAQFEQAFNKLNLPASVKGIGLDAAFSKLDPSGSGVVSKQNFILGMQSMMAPKNSQTQKALPVEAKGTPVTKLAASNAEASRAPAKIPFPPAGGAIGNTINISA